MLLAGTGQNVTGDGKSGWCVLASRKVIIRSRREWWQQLPHKSIVPGVRERVLDVLRALLEELGSHGALPQLSATSNLDRDLGLGSLERVELLTRLEDAFGCVCQIRWRRKRTLPRNSPWEYLHAGSRDRRREGSFRAARVSRGARTACVSQRIRS